MNLILILSCHETIFYDVLFKSIIQAILLYKKTFKHDRKTGTRTLSFGPKVSILQKGKTKIQAKASKFGKVVSKSSSSIVNKSKKGMKGVKNKMIENKDVKKKNKVSRHVADSVRFGKRKTTMATRGLPATSAASASSSDNESRNEQMSLHGSEHDGDRDDHGHDHREDFLPIEKHVSFHIDEDHTDKKYTSQEMKMKRHKDAKEVPIYATPAAVDIVIYDEAKLLKKLVMVGIGGILASPLIHILLIGLLPLWLTLFVVVGPFVILSILLGNLTIAFFQSLDEFYVEQFRQVESKQKIRHDLPEEVQKYV